MDKKKFYCYYPSYCDNKDCISCDNYYLADNHSDKREYPTCYGKYGKYKQCVICSYVSNCTTETKRLERKFSISKQASVYNLSTNVLSKKLKTAKCIIGVLIGLCISLLMLLILAILL